MPRAENFGDLITADHKVLSEESESRNNHRYAVVVLHVQNKIFPGDPEELNEVPGADEETKKSFRKHKGACKSSWKPRGSLKSFTLTIPSNLASLARNYPGITGCRHHTDQQQMGLLKGAVRRVKEGTSAVLLQSGLNENWWADPMECYTYLRNVTDLLSDGKTPYERRFGQPFKGPIIPFGSLVEYYPISAKDQSRIHQFGKKVLPGLFLGYDLYAGGLGRMTYWLQTLRSWSDGRIGNLLEKTQCERGDISQTRRIYFSNRRWTNQTSWRRSRPENIHLRQSQPSGSSAQEINKRVLLDCESTNCQNSETCL